jgi:peroxiredoxin
MLFEYRAKALVPFFLAVMVLFISACNSQENERSAAESATETNEEYVQAPDFEVETVEGDIISLAQTLDQNKPLVIYFTASWCPTCARNWPIMSEIYPEYQDRLTLVAISIDPTDDADVIRELAEKEGFTFPSTKGHPDIMMDFGVRSQATTVAVNREGYITDLRSNTALSEEEFRKIFESLLN